MSDDINKLPRPYSSEGMDASGDARDIDVQRIHAPVIREHNEPRDGLEPIPVWMGMCFGALLFWGGMYMSSNSGEYRGDVYDRPEPKPVVFKVEAEPTDEAGLRKLGEKVFAQCAACHQPTGEGLPNQFPALNKSEWVAGDKASVARLSRILLYGMSGEVTVRGNKFNGAMPAWGSQLSDTKIAAVLTYIRSNWDNKAGPVFAKDVKAARDAVGSRSSAMTAAEIEKVPLDAIDPGATPKK
ncbi:MAG: cytochrome c [Planctomycetes bacterium]|nr:cytochrome c [Planctomycetota bacterium]